MSRYYQILGVSPTATQEEIEEARIFNLKAFHPDKFSDSSEKQQDTARERTKAINEACTVLSNPDKRANYDRAYFRKTLESQETSAAGVRALNGNLTRSLAGKGKWLAFAVLALILLLPLTIWVRNDARVMKFLRTDLRESMGDHVPLIDTPSSEGMVADGRVKLGPAITAASVTPAVTAAPQITALETGTVLTSSSGPYETGADFSKYAMKMREQALTRVEPQTFVPTTSKPAPRRFAWKANIVTTVFWIGEKSNYKSAWDANWTNNYGGFDTPDTSARRNYIPVAFIPHQNPFYCALPYNDVAHGQFKPEAPLVIPWFKQEYAKRGSQPGSSVCKDRWIAIRKGNRTCYAQWEDCGPFRNDHFQYVFGNERPKPNLNRGSGLNVSPAVRDYLGLGPTDVTDWQFVEVGDVPPGPWRSYGDNNHFVLARRQAEQRVVQQSVADESDFEVAKRWMEALKANNATELINATALPFTFATTNRIKKCEDSFKTTAAFSRWTNCVRKSENYLISELGAGHLEIREDVPGSSKSANDLRAEDNIGSGALSDLEAKSLDTLAKKVSTNGTWVRASTSASETQYHFRWMIVKSADGSRQIAAFLVDTIVFE